LRRGVEPLDSTARLVALAVLILGTAAGITVPLVFDVSPWLTAVVLLGLLVVVVLEGSYRVWRETDQDRLSALTAQDAASLELGAQRQEHEKALVAARTERGKGRPPALSDQERLRSLLSDGHGLQLQIRRRTEMGIAELPLRLREQVTRWEGDVTGILARKPSWLDNFLGPLIPLSSTSQPASPHEALARITYQIDVLQRALRGW
jgi:hypothetical protein